MGVLVQSSKLVKLRPTRIRQALFWGILILSGVGIHLTTHGLRGLFMLLLVSSLLIVFGGKSNSHWTTKPLAGFVSTWLGRLSYPVYLVHFPVQLIIVLFLGGSTKFHDLSPAGLLTIYVTLTVLLAYLIFRYIEQPIQALAKRQNDL